MKRSAVLVNTARGPVVDEEALADALEDGTIFAAGIDVYEREPEVHPRLLAAPHAVLLPHIGSATEATRTTHGAARERGRGRGARRRASAEPRQWLSGRRDASCTTPLSNPPMIITDRGGEHEHARPPRRARPAPRRATTAARDRRRTAL